jgi:hypothetical protein
MAKSIADIVNDEFADLGAEETDALAKLDEVAEGLVQLDPAKFALAMAGLIQARIDKENAEIAVAITKQVIGAAMTLL